MIKVFGGFIFYNKKEYFAPSRLRGYKKFGGVRVYEFGSLI
jgi:hypothetical protein